MNGSTALKSILLLAANPKGTRGLRLQEEEREIKEQLRLAGYGKTPINSTGAARPRDIRQAMLDFKPQIVHFSGHGAEQDGLVFEDATGQEKLVGSEALADLFRIFSNRVECVVLNACYSEFQAKAIAQHVNYVVAMSKAIGDRAAIEFAIGFYSALGAGELIEFAYELGCNAIQLEGILEHLTPVLYKEGKLLQFNVRSSEIQDDKISQASVRSGFNTDVTTTTLTDQPLEEPVTVPRSTLNQAADRHFDAQFSAKKDETAISLINKLFDALCSSNTEVGLEKFKAIAHKSLFQNGQIDLTFRKNNFNVAFMRKTLYKRPIEIVDSQPTGRTKLGLRADKEDGQEKKYAIARNDNFKGLYHIRIFFPANSGAAKISGLSL